MDVIRNKDVTLHVAKYLTSYIDKLKNYWAGISFSFMVITLLLLLFELSPPLANPYLFYPLEFIGFCSTIIGFWLRIRPTEVSDVIEKYDLTNNSFLETENNNLPYLKGFLSHQLDAEAENSFHYIPVPEENNLKNINVYDLKLAEYLSQNHDIKLDNTQLREEKEIYKALGSEIRKYQKIALYLRSAGRGSFYNSPKVSLCSLKEENGTYIATLGHTSYFTSVLTNDLFAYKLTESQVQSTDIANFRQHFPARKYEGALWRLNDFDKCPGISNHVGSAVMAVSKDNIPIVQRQNKTSQQYAGQLHVSGAGSLELSDLEIVRSRIPNATFSDFVKYGMSRELLEETGFVPENSKHDKHIKIILDFAAKNIYLLSVARDVIRGGLPIFLGFAKFDHLNEKIVMNESKETKIIGDIKTVVNNGGEMKKFVDEYVIGKDVSTQLVLFKHLLARESVRERFNEAIAE